MDQIQSVKSEFRLRHWAKIIADCQAGPLTVKAWCEANGICAKTYYYWLRKVRQRTLENLPSCHNDLSKVPAESLPTFSKLEVQPPAICLAFSF